MSKRSSGRQSSGMDSWARHCKTPLAPPSTLSTSASSVSNVSGRPGASPSVKQLVARQRNNHASTRVSMDSLTSLDSVRLLPGGVVALRKSSSGESRHTNVRRGSQADVRGSHTIDMSSRRGGSPYHNRPKEPMRVLAPGLRETKPNSLRMIKDPEEVQRMKRRMINEAANQNREITIPTSPRPLSRQDDKINQDTNPVRLSPSPNKLIDVEDAHFETLTDSEASKLHGDESHKQHSGDRVMKSRLKPPGTYFVTSISEKRPGVADDRQAAVGKTHIPTAVRRPVAERRQIHGDKKQNGSAEKQAAIDQRKTPDLKPCHVIELMDSSSLPQSPLSQTRQQPTPDDRLHETTPDYKSPDNLPENLKLNNTIEKKSGKKSLVKKLKSPFKMFYKVKETKVAPLTSPDQTSSHGEKKKEEELAQIASMFCVESPAQAGLRRYIANKEYVDDASSCLKPAVWGCDIGGRQEEEYRAARGPGSGDTHVDVGQVEQELELMDINNNGLGSVDTDLRADVEGTMASSQ